MTAPAFIAVDMQNDFASPGGIFYARRESVDFVLDELVPFLAKKRVKTLEIVSDYRPPRPGDPRDCCHPGEWGYASVLPRQVVKEPVWIKSMNSPAWVRKNIGEKDKEPGVPFPDPAAFHEWLEKNGGDARRVVLFGLTLDRCVLCTAQELSFRGYDVQVLREATDVASGSLEEKNQLLSDPPLAYWMRPVTFSSLLEAEDLG